MNSETSFPVLIFGIIIAVIIVCFFEFLRDTWRYRRAARPEKGSTILGLFKGYVKVVFIMVTGSVTVMAAFILVTLFTTPYTSERKQAMYSELNRLYAKVFGHSEDRKEAKQETLVAPETIKEKGPGDIPQMKSRPKQIVEEDKHPPVKTETEPVLKPPPESAKPETPKPAPQPEKTASARVEQPVPKESPRTETKTQQKAQTAPAQPATSIRDIKTLKVKVLCGNGDLGSAKQMADVLRGKGYTIEIIGFADRSNFTRNTVYYTPAFHEDAKRLSLVIGKDTELKPLTWSSVFDLIVVTGKKK
jgi:hypothetical protein